MFKKIKSRSNSRGPCQFWYSIHVESLDLWWLTAVPALGDGHGKTWLPCTRSKMEEQVICHLTSLQNTWRAANVSSLNGTPLDKENVQYPSYFLLRGQNLRVLESPRQKEQPVNRANLLRPISTASWQIQGSVNRVSCHLLISLLLKKSCQKLLCSQIYLWLFYHCGVLTESLFWIHWLYLYSKLHTKSFSLKPERQQY